MKIVKKVVFWMITIFVVMFMGCWTLSTASYMHIGENFPNAIADGFNEVADQVGQIIGIQKSKPDLVLDFKNGTIGFQNTHISW